MDEPGGDLDLAEEPVGGEGGGELGAEHLDRNLAVVLEVLRQVDRSHSTTAELALDRVAVGEGGEKPRKVIGHREVAPGWRGAFQVLLYGRGPRWARVEAIATFRARATSNPQFPLKEQVAMQALADLIPRWFVLSVLSALSAFSPAALLAQQAERYTITGDEVAIYNLAGEIKVEPGGGPGVTAEVTRGGADAPKLKVSQSEIEGRRSLRVIYPADKVQYARMSQGSSTNLRVRDDGTFSDRDDDDDHRDEGRRVTIAGGGGGLAAHADLRVIVPRGKQLALYLAAGKVNVVNVEGDLRIDAASAPVTTSNTRGEIQIEVGSGEVQVTQSRGDLSVDTGSGAVSVSDVRGEQVSIETGSGEVTTADVRTSQLSVETGSGDIRATKLMASQVSLETGSGAVSADVSGEVWNVNVETGSGDITLRVPPTVGAEVDIETSSGDIETDFEVSVTRHARDHLTGRIGDGRGKIDIETGSGGIKLLKAST
jgi:lia operon protein LiaG